MLVVTSGLKHKCTMLVRGDSSMNAVAQQPRFFVGCPLDKHRRAEHKPHPTHRMRMYCSIECSWPLVGRFGGGDVDDDFGGGLVAGDGGDVDGDDAPSDERVD